MPDASSLLGALPIGLILFVGMYLGMRRRNVGLRKASDEYPDLAKRLGLSHVPPAHARMIGKMRGSLEGHDVVVDPDEQMRVAVRFREPVPILLRSYERTRMPPAGMERLDTGRAGIDGLFKERYAAPVLADVLYEDLDALEKALAPFRTRRSARLKDFVVSEEGAHCIFDFGKPPHIPTDVAEGVLRDLSRLVTLLQGAALRAASSESAAPSTR